MWDLDDENPGISSNFLDTFDNATFSSNHKTIGAKPQHELKHFCCVKICLSDNNSFSSHKYTLKIMYVKLLGCGRIELPTDRLRGECSTAELTTRMW